MANRSPEVKPTSMPTIRSTNSLLDLDNDPSSPFVEMGMNRSEPRGVGFTQIKAVREEAIRTDLPPLVRPRLEQDLTGTVQRHFNGPHRNMSIQGKVLRRYGTLEEALIYAVDAPQCGGITLSGFRRYECREGRMYKQQLDESLWLKLPTEVPAPHDPALSQCMSYRLRWNKTTVGLGLASSWACARHKPYGDTHQSGNLNPSSHGAPCP